MYITRQIFDGTWKSFWLRLTLNTFASDANDNMVIASQQYYMDVMAPVITSKQCVQAKNEENTQTPHYRPFCEEKPPMTSTSPHASVTAKILFWEQEQI